MRASFFGFNVTNSALFMARNALNVTANNIANAETPGHSRQVALLRASTPLTFNNGRGMVGTGAEMYGVGQVRSAFLDQKYWTQNSTLGEFSVKSQHLTLTESILNATSETNLTSAVDNFFNTLQDLTTTANDLTYGTNVINTATTLATQISSKYSNLVQQQDDLNQEVKVIVNVINSIGVQIRNLNEQIAKFEMDGSNANSLRDQRATLIDELSKYVNVDAKEVEVNTSHGPEKRFVVQMNGWDFVNHFNVNTLGVEPREVPTNPNDVAGLYDIMWQNTGQSFNMNHSGLTGELKALIDLRDGNNGNFLQGTTSSIELNEDGESHTVTITNFSKHDLNHTGKLSFIDPATRREVEFSYDDLEKVFDADGNIVALKFNVVGMTEEQAEGLTGSAVKSGETNAYKGIPYYMERLNDLVRTVAKAFNEGLDRNGDPIPGVTPYLEGFDSNGVNHGHLFFTAVDRYGNEQTEGGMLDYSVFNARNFQVSSVLQDNPRYLATSISGESGESNNELILGFMEIKNYDSLFREGSINDYTIAIAVELGIDLKQANSFDEHYTEIMTSIQNQRLSVMGVSIDEETINMVKFQQLFNIASKMTNIIDGIYNTLINGLGAGR